MKINRKNHHLSGLVINPYAYSEYPSRMDEALMNPDLDREGPKPKSNGLF